MQDAPMDVPVKGAAPPQLSATTEQAREHAAPVALLRVRPDKLTWPEITTEVGSALAVWERHVPATLVGGAEEEALDAAAADIALWESQGHTFLTILEEDYPIRLRGIHEAPPVLFASGALRSDDPAVSVVGSRDASERGLAIARSVATTLAREGVTVLGGLALGIDTAAHHAAIEAAGGRTVAVIGTGGSTRRTRPRTVTCTGSSPRTACCSRSSGLTPHRRCTPS